MPFIDTTEVEVRKPLMEARFPFDRADDLADAMKWCATDYYTKASIGRRFESRGIVVIGDSRQGKSTEIDRMLTQFNNGTTVMPDGRPARIVSCLLSGKVTWKDLGIEILSVLGYSMKGRHSQSDIWSKVRKYAELQGVVGIHFDECQHVFTEGDSLTNQKILDSFKSLLKDQQWPLMLILSGVPSLATQIRKEEQIAWLLRTVSFDGIELSRKSDMEELMNLMFIYADKAQLEFDDFEMQDFLERLTFAACQRWGLVIELLIEALSLALLNGDKVCKNDHFSQAFSQISGTPLGYSPFSMPNYQDNFDQEKLFMMYEKTRTKKAPKKK
ncbi:MULTISPECIES: ATP-binding protein [Pacificibacter]|uniref:ATP-binding protein n=1 Tax=Pacificibacter TaxID=1042323 RepID=UPI001C08CB44|nr:MULTISPECIES: ATP-binding protein [Pacificibacter]MBU2936461.1 ATP-binding protein [Pacificibacter marinus]MDO6614737.1 ATP-binding protein [Pacificibacter sp. 1_MG-2023]